MTSMTTSHPKAEAALRTCRSALEARWMIFLSTWKIPFQYNEHKSDPLEPDFWLERQQLGLAILSKRDGDERFGECLQEYVPYVEETGHRLLICFGSPKIRLPAPQGWLMSLKDNGKINVVPSHIIERPSAARLELACVGAAASFLACKGAASPWQRLFPLTGMETAYLATEHHALWVQ